MIPKPEIRQKAAALLNQMRMSENQGKPANATNGVTFLELMRQLRGEA